MVTQISKGALNECTFFIFVGFHPTYIAFYRFKGDDVDYLIAHNKKGDNYFHKVTAPELSGTETEPLGPYNSIITHKNKNFNPSLFERIKQLFNKDN